MAKNYGTTQEILNDFRKLKTPDEKAQFTLKIVEDYNPDTIRSLKVTEMAPYFILLLKLTTK